jgi:hypothetical protein
MISPAHCVVVIYHKWNENEHIFMVGEKKKKKVSNGCERRKRMFYLVGIGGLVVERERNCVRERPLEKGVVLSRQDFDVNGDVSSFSRPVTIQEQ